ncbi:MAG: flagellar basal body-associated protein FliL [Lamprobacter sp.]|uniref:flagellar basal body-associated protein FliL n=1 Tax=Lamprobacter sp. TaxID=3100796 RepID=UPI002B259CB6|nr:flagellar basal body-associated protein FliL [Lamprobacter sp.]MEA3639805.1 flagellar basal body-associated protein FliL [Lamprobacter sp.]
MAQANSGSNKLLWMMSLLVVLSLIAAGVAAYIALQAQSGSETEKTEAATDRHSPIFVDVAPFTINMTSSRGVSRLLYIGMTFKVGSEKTREILETHMPQVRSRLLMQLSAQQVDELTSTEGKTQLANKLITALQKPPLSELQPELAIEEVLFTEFIVQ